MRSEKTTNKLSKSKIFLVWSKLLFQNSLTTFKKFDLRLVVGARRAQLQKQNYKTINDIIKIENSLVTEN